MIASTRNQAGYFIDCAAHPEHQPLALMIRPGNSVQGRKNLKRVGRTASVRRMSFSQVLFRSRDPMPINRYHCSDPFWWTQNVSTLRGLLFSFALLLSACTNNDQSISTRLAEQFDSNQESIDLAKLGPKDWERFCVLGPYSVNEAAEKLLGFNWDVDRHSDVGANDGITLLLFVTGQEVLTYADHPRNKGDFLKLQPRCLSRSQAALVRVSEPGGWIQLVPK